MADYSSQNRVGRFGLRNPAPITTFVKVDDRRSDQGLAVGRAEISEHVAMPVSVTDGVVTKIETIVEQEYTTSEVIENYATIESVQGSNRSAFPRGLYPRQTLNNSKPNSGTNEAVTNAWNKSIGGAAKDGANEWSRQATGGIANSTGASAWTMLAEGALGASEPSRQIGGGAKDIGTNGWSGSTEGGINKSGTGDAGAIGLSNKPIGGGNKDVGPNQWNRPGVAVETVKEPSKAPQTQAALAWRGQFPPLSVTPTIEPKTIDSNEAATKYNGISSKQRPQRKKVIDSHEAAKKYKGVFINGMK